MRRFLLLGLFWFFCVFWFWPSNAAAAGITYEGAPECPSRDDVTKRIAESAPRARDVTMTVRATVDGYAGEASVGTGEDAVERHVEGRTCAAVVDALVFVLAMTRPTPPVPAPAPSAPATITTVDSPVSDRPSRKSATDVRSPTEVAIGLDSQLRELGDALLLGNGLVGELSAPGLGVDWYRPSLRGTLAYQYQATMPGYIMERPRLTFVGTRLEACPLAAALVSTRRVDLIAGACGVLHVGSLNRRRDTFWADGGMLGRMSIQIGRKGHFRGFIELGLGVVRRLSARTEGEAMQDKSMITMALGGGVLFP